MRTRFYDGRRDQESDGPRTARDGARAEFAHRHEARSRSRTVDRSEDARQHAHGQKIQTEVIAEVVGDTIKMKLKQPSFINEILPVLEGPYEPWPDIDGLVHVGGRLGNWNVRVCDYQRLESSPGHRDMVLTCLTCLTWSRPPSRTVNISTVT
jgi:hypothetical protein